MSTDVLHAPGMQEHALCGLAFDAFESGDEDTPVVMAVHGQTATCKNCRAFLDWVRLAYRGYKYQGE